MFDKTKKIILGKVILPKLFMVALKNLITVITGFVGGTYFTAKLQPMLDQYGLHINTVELLGSLTVALTTGSRALMHFIQYRFFDIKNDPTA